MNVLVLAPHPDDEAIGCGGAIRLHVNCGDRVAVTFLTSGEFGLRDLPPAPARELREYEACAAAEVLGVKALEFLRSPDAFLSEHVTETAGKLAPILRSERPDRVYLPHVDDGHPDHRCTITILGAALRNVPELRPRLLAYEIWTALAGYDDVVDVSSVMAAKLLAIRRYRSQLADVRYDRAIRGLNQYRGIVAARCRFAEVFAEIRAESGTDG